MRSQIFRTVSSTPYHGAVILRFNAAFAVIKNPMFG